MLNTRKKESQNLITLYCYCTKRLKHVQMFLFFIIQYRTKSKFHIPSKKVNYLQNPHLPYKCQNTTSSMPKSKISICHTNKTKHKIRICHTRPKYKITFCHTKRSKHKFSIYHAKIQINITLLSYKIGQSLTQSFKCHVKRAKALISFPYTQVTGQK